MRPTDLRTGRDASTSNSLPATLLLMILATAQVAAQTVQDLWTFPRGPDLSTTINVGSKITIGWTKDLPRRFSDNCPGCLPTSANLYITSYGISGQLPFKHKIASKIDVTSDLSVDWTVSLPENEVSCQGCGAWAFRFMADDSNGDVSSSVFSVKPARPGSNSDTSTTTTPTSTTISQSTANTSNPQTTNTPVAVAPIPTSQPASNTNPGSTPADNNTNNNQPVPSGGMSTAAKAGAGVGGALGAILLVLLGWFLSGWYKRRKSHDTEEGIRDVIATTYLEVKPGGQTSRTAGRNGAISPSGPRHKPLSDFIPGSDEGKGNWDPNETFYKPAASTTTATVSVRSQTSVPDFLGMPPPTPDSPSFELLPRSGPRS